MIFIQYTEKLFVKPLMLVELKKTHIQQNA